MSRKVQDPEAAYWDRRLKAEAEDDDFELFAAAYLRATGIELIVEDRPEPPDFECRRSDGSLIGVELTQITWSPDDAMWHRIIEKSGDMPFDRAVKEAERLLIKKSNKLSLFSTDKNILLLIVNDAEFALFCHFLSSLPISIYEEFGFTEVWVGDYTGIREGAHYAIEMQGLYPEHTRVVVPRPDWDAKPYG